MQSLRVRRDTLRKPCDRPHDRLYACTATCHGPENEFRITTEVVLVTMDTPENALAAWSPRFSPPDGFYVASVGAFAPPKHWYEFILNFQPVPVVRDAGHGERARRERAVSIQTAGGF